MTKPASEPPVFFVRHPEEFAYVASRLEECDECVAVTQSLSPELVAGGYRYGIFPWFKHSDLFYWFSPLDRTVLIPTHLHRSRTFGKRLRQAARFRYGKHDCLLFVDKETKDVIRACAETVRKNQPETWITSEYIDTYGLLADLGYVHSISVHVNGHLVGGLWGTCFGKIFVGESMFHLCPDVSKIALALLCHLSSDLGVDLIDCQAHTDHLQSLGAGTISRATFTRLNRQLYDEPLAMSWSCLRDRPLNDRLSV